MPSVAPIKDQGTLERFQVTNLLANNIWNVPVTSAHSPSFLRSLQGRRKYLKTLSLMSLAFLKATIKPNKAQSCTAKFASANEDTMDETAAMVGRDELLKLILCAALDRTK
jgi:hypothetical protein